MLKLFSTILFLIVISSINFSLQKNARALTGKTICIDPGHGGTAATDSYRVGALGEREEWINLRVGLKLKKLLEEKGATVIMTRTADSAVKLDARAEMATAKRADLFVSIHHNATADVEVNFPIVYFHGAASENEASVQAAKLLAVQLKNQLFGGNGHVSVVSDYTIFPRKGAAVLRGSYGIPGLLAEASFFTNANEEKKLKEESYNAKEAFAYASAIEEYFRQSHAAIKKKSIPDRLPVFEVLEEADRMKPEALNWLNDFESARELSRKKDTASLTGAYNLFTRSARSFPDSWVARECHEQRAVILQQLKRFKEAGEESVRAKEFYTVE